MFFTRNISITLPIFDIFCRPIILFKRFIQLTFVIFYVNFILQKYLIIKTLKFDILQF